MIVPDLVVYGNHLFSYSYTTGITFSHKIKKTGPEHWFDIVQTGLDVPQGAVATYTRVNSSNHIRIGRDYIELPFIIREFLDTLVYINSLKSFECVYKKIIVSASPPTFSVLDRHLDYYFQPIKRVYLKYIGTVVAFASLKLSNCDLTIEFRTTRLDQLMQLAEEVEVDECVSIEREKSFFTQRAKYIGVQDSKVVLEYINTKLKTKIFLPVEKYFSLLRKI